MNDDWYAASEVLRIPISGDPGHGRNDTTSAFDVMGMLDDVDVHLYFLYIPIYLLSR